MIVFYDKKVTATEFAKLSIEDAIDNALFNEYGETEVYMSPKEKDRIMKELIKQTERVNKFLGYWEIYRKLDRRVEIDKDTLFRYSETQRE